MIAESFPGNKRNSRDFKKKLPPHLRLNNTNKSSKYSSPLKNHVEIKDDKSPTNSMHSNNNTPVDENTNPNVQINEIKDQKQRIIDDSLFSSESKRPNSLNNTNYDVLQSEKSNFSNGHSLNQHENQTNEIISEDNAVKDIRNNIQAIISKTSVDASFSKENIEDSINDSKVFKNENIKSSENVKPVKRTNKTTRKVVVGPRRSNSLPKNVINEKNLGNNYLDPTATITRKTSRGGSDDKIKQILGDGAVNSFERNNSQQLNERVGKKGNMGKIQQILIDGNNKNKNKDVNSLSSPTLTSNPPLQTINGKGNMNKIQQILIDGKNKSRESLSSPHTNKPPLQNIGNGKGNMEKIQQILIEGKSKSRESLPSPHTNKPPLQNVGNISFTSNKGNMDKIQQILIDGKNKNKGLVKTSSDSDISSSLSMDSEDPNSTMNLPPPHDNGTKPETITVSKHDSKPENITSTNLNDNVIIPNVDIKASNNLTTPKIDIKDTNNLTKSNVDIKATNDITTHDQDIKTINSHTTPNVDIKASDNNTTPNVDIKAGDNNTIPNANVNIKAGDDNTTPNVDIKVGDDNTTPNVDIKVDVNNTTPDLDIKATNNHTTPDVDIKIDNSHTTSDLDIKASKLASNNLDVKASKIATTNLDIKASNITSPKIDSKNSTANTNIKSNKNMPQSILLNSGPERNNRNKSISIVEKNRIIRNINGLGSPRLDNSFGSPRINNNFNSAYLNNSYASIHLNNSFASSRYDSSFISPHLDNSLRSPHLDNSLRSPHLDNSIRSPYLDNSLRSPRLDNSLGSPLLDNSMGSLRLDNSVGSLRLDNGLSSPRLGNTNRKKKRIVSVVGNEPNMYKNNNFKESLPLRSNSFKNPSNIINPMDSQLQQGIAPHQLDKDEAMASINQNQNQNKRTSGYGVVDRNSEYDIFSFGAKKKQEEQLNKEKKNNSLKVSKESLIFSGYIEKLSSRHKFQKRILRFDGVFITCLSQKKKHKLPANTTFTTVSPPCFAENSEEAKVYLDVIKRLYSNLSPGPEFSSPLIAIDDYKNNKNSNSNPNLKARHYYYPKWIINIKDLVFVRPLIHPDLYTIANRSIIYKRVEPEFQQYLSGDLDKDKKTFIIITRDNSHYVIRSFTEKEYNLWLFMITRSKEILEELSNPRISNDEAQPISTSTSPPPPPAVQQQFLSPKESMMMNPSGLMNNNRTNSPGPKMNVNNNNDDSNIRRFMAREDDNKRQSLIMDKRRSRQYNNNNVNATGNNELLSLYSNTTPIDVQIKNQYTDLIDRNLPKDPLHLHNLLFDHWKEILEKLYNVDHTITASVTRAENSELISILRASGNDGINEANIKNPHIWIPEVTPVINTIVPPQEEYNVNPKFDDAVLSNFKDKALVDAITNIPTSDAEKIRLQMSRLKPRPRSGGPEIYDGSEIINLRKISPSPASSSSSAIFRRRDPNFVNSISNKHPESDIFRGVLEDLTVYNKIYTVDTIEPPQPLTIVKTSKNRPLKQKRNSWYTPTEMENINIPSSDPTLQQPIIQSIPWDSNLTFTIMGLLRIFHRLSGVPFIEGGENENNTPPTPIPHWYYQFCVKSIPIHVVQIQNSMIDYLQELEYQYDKQDEENPTVALEQRLQNKNILSERYRVIKETLDSFIKLTNIWDEIMNQWKMEMIENKIKGKEMPIRENDIDDYLLENVETNDVINVHSRIKEYIGKEILMAGRNMLKLFEK